MAAEEQYLHRQQREDAAKDLASPTQQLSAPLLSVVFIIAVKFGADYIIIISSSSSLSSPSLPCLNHLRCSNTCCCCMHSTLMLSLYVVRHCALCIKAKVSGVTCHRLCVHHPAHSDSFKAHFRRYYFVQPTGFCLTGPISLCVDSCVYVFLRCIVLLLMCCIIVTWSGRPGKIEA